MCVAKVFDQHRARRAPTTAVTLTSPSRRRALIGDDLAVVRKRAGVDERSITTPMSCSRKMYRRVTISVWTLYTLAWRSAGWRRPDAEALRERIWPFLNRRSL